jgi:ferric-dicitrate binding protein FerR (iron transport regulator)
MIDEEEVTAELLRLAGAPPDPSSDRTARVREAVRRGWRHARRRRTIRRAATTAIVGIAASLAIVVWINRSGSPAPAVAEAVALSQRIQGRPQVVRQAQRARAPEPLSLSTSIYPDDVIETDDVSRAALQTPDGSSLRVDRLSRVRFVARTVIEITAGAVYVATSEGSHGFEVRTAMGGVRDEGTRFEVRLTSSSLRIRVRSGTVEIVPRGGRAATTSAGTEAMVTTDGVVTRAVPSYGSEWAWTADVAPPFAIEGRPLGMFLEHISAEEGWKLSYAAPEIAASAKSIILHGSIDGLTAEDALGVALATSGLQYRLRDGELLVSKAVDAR